MTAIVFLLFVLAGLLILEGGFPERFGFPVGMAIVMVFIAGHRA